MALVLDRPIRLFPIFRERPWGRDDLAPYFSNELRNESRQRQRIGEAWFTFQDNSTAFGISLGELLEKHRELLGSAADPDHPGACPLLVKFLFTSERLSVQVHPDDAYAQIHHQSLGKTEAWYVIEAEPAGEVAVGFRERISPERLKESSESGEIEQLLDWRRVKAGDIIFTPAGTVHAIGAGVTICEIQENSDLTYRLYDYGRPRELHLEHGMKVSHLGPHEHEPETVSLAPWRDQLLENSYFRIERLRLSEPLHVAQGSPVYLLFVCLKGSGSIGGEHFEAGQCWMIPAANAAVTVDGPGSEWILTYTAEQAIQTLRSGTAG